MICRSACASLLLAALLACSAPAPGAGAPWIVAPERTPAAQQLARAAGARLVDPVLGIWAAPAPAAHRLAARLRARGLLRFQERDVPVRPLRLTAHQAGTGAWWRAPVLAGAGETPAGPAGPASAPVGVIESGGFDAAHPDIPPSVVLRRPSSEPQDDTAHGTAVVSVIAGRGPRVLGITPGADVRVYGFSFRHCSDAAAAIRRAADDGALVINMSYGFWGDRTCFSHRIATSYASAYAVMVAAAGNERVQPWVQPGNDHHVLTVGAVNALDLPTGFSNQSTSIDLSAPGEGIGVACPAFADTEDGVRDGSCTWDGTSFAAPIVAAVAARLLAARPELSASQAQSILVRSARDIGGRVGFDISTGYGRVDLPAALAEPTPTHDPLEPNDDVEWVDGRHFRPDRPLLRTRRTERFRATLDALKDPVDVYPVWVGPFEGLDVVVRPSLARVRASILHPSARTIRRRSSFLAGRRDARPRRAGNVGVSNAGRRGRKVWVAVEIPRGPQLFTDYQITLRRR